VTTISTPTDVATSLLGRAVGSAPFIFVVGKGGAGKTTTAGALALELADAGLATHLISTDPAHSIADLFRTRLSGTPTASACSPKLTLEEYDAAAHANRWYDHAVGAAAELIEGGTYLDEEDVAGFARLAVPGIDEMMAVLRLVELAGSASRVVVDTAPTGHTLRLLDAGATHEGIARALRAMADKAAAVASSFAGRQVRLRGETLIAELTGYARAFRELLDQAVFVIAAGSDAVVAAETDRLASALLQRRLRAVATVFTGTAGAGHGLCLSVPLLAEPRGCDGLRTWRAALRLCTGSADPAAASQAGASPAAHQRPDPAAAGAPEAPTSVPGPADRAAVPGPAEPAPLAPVDPAAAPALPWIEALPLDLLVFAGKGGVGKSTCAAAAALALSRSRAVLLCSTDPAGSLDDVLGTAAVAAVRLGRRLRVVQVDAEAQAQQLRDAYRTEVDEAFERIGLAGHAALDRRVIDELWSLAPPGIDEFAALAVLLDAADTQETILLDPAPTGHFLRLLTMPQLALGWTRQLMRIIVKYRASGMAGSAAETLLRAARALRGLQQRLCAAERTGVFVVTLSEPLVHAETERLLAALGDGAVPVAAVIANRQPTHPAGGGQPALPVREPPVRETPVILAPAVAAPVGADALRDFIEAWRLVR
jgi:arsenite/tail-anchored protein-transporting ATPase